MNEGSEEVGGAQNRDFVASLARGLEVIKTFSRETPAMTLAEVARNADMTRAAARRFLLTLQELGYVRSSGRLFELTPKVLELGYSYLSSLEFPAIAAPFMEEVVDEIQESCSASVLNQEDIVYVVRIPTSRIMAVSLTIGTKLPAYCTSMGRVLLAGLDEAALKDFLPRAKLKPRTAHTVTDKAELRRIIAEVRRSGYALVDEELELGLRSIAVPVRNRRGGVIAAINVSTHTSRATPQEMIDRFLPVLRKAAERIQRLLP
jgi:IclR family pca regulon transcriptional regulator